MLLLLLRTRSGPFVPQVVNGALVSQAARGSESIRQRTTPAAAIRVNVQTKSR
jgi:hypothetical protein